MALFSLFLSFFFSFFFYFPSSSKFSCTDVYFLDLSITILQVFNVRWAIEDPNPRAKAEFLEDAKDRFFQAMQKKVTPEVMNQYVMVAQTEMAAESQIGVHGKNIKVTDFYPSTDSQYSQTPQSLEAMKYGYTAATYAQQQGQGAEAPQASDQQQRSRSSISSIKWAERDIT